MSKTSLHYTERVQSDSEMRHPLIRSVDPNAMRLQLQRRDPRRVVQHPLWCEVETRMKERLAPIRADEARRMDHGLAEFGRVTDPLPGSLSMIFSVGLLAYLSNPATTFGFWWQALRPGGLLVFSTLGPDSFRGLALALGDDRQSCHVAGYPDMHDLGDALIQARFSDPVMESDRISLIYPDAESALKDLRLLGGNPLSGRPAGLRGRSWRERVLQALGGLECDGKVNLKVELVFGHAWKMEQKRPGTDKTGSKDQTHPVRWFAGLPKNLDEDI